MKIFIIILYILPSVVFAQYGQIEYIQKMEMHGPKMGLLLFNNEAGESAYSVYGLNQDGTRGRYMKNYVYSKSGEERIVHDEGAMNYFIYKDRESMDMMNWELVTGQDTLIAGFTCQGAIMTFRGRNYTAWYTGDIPTSIGPWKFGGLPGLILKIKTDDDTYIVEARKIVVNTTPIVIEKYDPKGFIDAGNSFDEFVQKRTRIKQEFVDRQNERMNKLTGGKNMGGYIEYLLEL